MRTLDVCLGDQLAGFVTLGYHVPLDVCFGDQLVGFVTLGIYA